MESFSACGLLFLPDGLNVNFPQACGLFVTFLCTLNSKDVMFNKRARGMACNCCGVKEVSVKKKKQEETLFEFKGHLVKRTSINETLEK